MGCPPGGFWFYCSCAPPTVSLNFPRGSNGEELACIVGDQGLIPGSGRFPGEGSSNPLHYSCLENPMDGGAWQTTDLGVTKSWSRLSDITSLLSHCGFFFVLGSGVSFFGRCQWFFVGGCWEVSCDFGVFIRKELAHVLLLHHLELISLFTFLTSHFSVYMVFKLFLLLYLEVY